ncbi:hypothetical protein OQA88_9291 [Cercophora sp. LCS_1]
MDTTLAKIAEIKVEIRGNGYFARKHYLVLKLQHTLKRLERHLWHSPGAQPRQSQARRAVGVSTAQEASETTDDEDSEGESNTDPNTEPNTNTKSNVDSNTKADTDPSTDSNTEPDEWTVLATILASAESSREPSPPLELENHNTGSEVSAPEPTPETDTKTDNAKDHDYPPKTDSEGTLSSGAMLDAVHMHHVYLFEKRFPFPHGPDSCSSCNWTEHKATMSNTKKELPREVESTRVINSMSDLANPWGAMVDEHTWWTL